MVLLQAHYRSPVQVDTDTIEAAEKALDRLDALARRRAGVALADRRARRRPCSTAFRAAHGRRPRHAAAPWRWCSTTVTGPTPRSTPATWPAPPRCVAAVLAMAEAVGLELRRRRPRCPPTSRPRSRPLDAARAAKDYATADALRAELQAAGWVVETTKQGTTVRRA